MKLGLSEESEWLQYFNEQKQKVQELKSKIDQLVYKLYGLTEREIMVVEGVG